MGLLNAIRKVFGRGENGLGNCEEGGRLSTLWASSNGAASGLLSGALDTRPWEGMLGLPHQGQDLVLLVAGTLGKTASHYTDLLHHQDLRTSNLVAELAAFTTRQDLEALAGCWAPGTVLQIRKKGATTYTVHLPNRGALVAGHIATLGNFNGSGSDPDFAVRVLETDPLSAECVSELVAAVVAKVREHNQTACNLLTLFGAGGSYPYGNLAEELLQRSMDVKRRHQVAFLPPLWQGQNRRIAREWMVDRLRTTSPENALLYLVQQDNPGKQAWDPALAAGLLTITGTDQLFGQPDESSIFTMLRERGDVVVAKPRVVRMPLRRLGRVGPFRRQNHQVLHDSPLPAILGEMKRLVDREEEGAFHLFTVGGRFTEDEVRQIQRQAQVLHRRGGIQVLVNHLIPATLENTAEFPLVDFVVPQGQPELLLDLASPDEDVPVRAKDDGLSREELVERLAGSREVSRPRRVHEATRRIAEVKGR